MALVKATSKISKAKFARNDTMLLMQPYANWEEFLVPAPISVAILGELMFISSNDDFSISKNSPKDGYKLIRYPESFRACLTQVTHSGWVAFNEAHKNMDQIRLHSSSVCGYVKLAVNIIKQNDDTLIEAMLPDQLENIETVAETCTRLSASTEAKFEFVIELIAELMEACVNSKAAYGEELKEMARKIEESKLRKEAAEENKQFTQKLLQQLSKQVESANEQYQKAMDSMPSGWEFVGMNFVEGISDSVNSILASGVKLMANPACLMALTGNPIGDIEALSTSGLLTQLVGTMSSFFGQDQAKQDQPCSDKTKENSVVEWLVKQFQRIEGGLDKDSKCKANTQCLDICEKANSICKILTGMTGDGKTDESVTKSLSSELNSLKELTLKFDTQSKAAMGAPSFPVMPPQLASELQSSSKSKKASDVAAENARFRIEQSRAQLSQVQEMMQKTTDDMQKNQRELTEILVTMQTCVVKEIDFKTTINLLVKGLDAMGKVKDQWAKMVRFFQMISNIIKTTLSPSLQNFVKMGHKVGKKALGYTANNLMKDMLYQEAFYVSNVASLVNMISGTYTEVSNSFLMDRISSLGKLVGLDPTMGEFATERRKLQDGCKDAEEGIKSLVLKNKRDFERNMTERLAKIEGELQAALPPATENEIKKIKEIVDKGMEELAEGEED